MWYCWARTVCTILPISVQSNCTKFEQTRRSRCQVNPFGQNFENFPVIYPWGVVFSKNAKNRLFSTSRTSGRHNSAMIKLIDRQKAITKWCLCGLSSFHFYRWNQFKVIPLACTLRTNLPKFSATADASWRHTAHNADTGSDDRLLRHVTCPSWQKIEM